MRKDRNVTRISAIGAIASTAVLAGACTVGAPVISPTSAEPSTVAVSAMPSASLASDSPRVTTPAATSEPTAITSPSRQPSESAATPTASQQTPLVIPAAELHGPFEPVAGLAATYCIDGDCQEVPPSPAELPRVSAGLGGSGLSVELPPGTPVASWEVTAEPLSSFRASRAEVLGSGGSEPYAALYVAAPEKGDWLLRAQIHSDPQDFVDYYWSLRVREPSRPPPMSDVGPPDGILDGGRHKVTGLEGSYCFEETCADIAQLPTARISPLLRVPGAGPEMTFQLRGMAEFATWSVTYWDARHDQGSETIDLAVGGREGSATRAATFEPPPPGDWQTRIRVDFPEGGDATYFIHIVVA